MKNILMRASLFCIMLAVFSACSTSQKFMVHGKPGTEIYILKGIETSDSKEKIGKIPQSGQLKVSLSDDRYHPFLLSKAQGSDTYVPFVLDIKHNSHKSVQFFRKFGHGIAITGASVALGGGIAVALGAGSVCAVAMLGGLGAMAIGGAIALPAYSRLTQDTYQWEIQYLYNQKANDNLLITNAIPYKNESVNKTKENRKVKANTPRSSSVAMKETETPVRSISSDNVKRELNDPARKCAGTYSGCGNLSANNELIEEYDNMSIVLTRTGKDEVVVNVLEGSNDFFGRESRYSVQKLPNGNISLVHSKIKNAVITIYPDGRLSYKHPRVEIDGDIYVLSFDGSKQ